MMKKEPIFAAFRAVMFTTILLGAVSCQKPNAEVSQQDQPAEADAPAASSPSTTPPPRAIAVAPPSPDPLAPAGTFFLLQKVSVTTDDGILGFKPGTALREVKPGTYLAGKQELQLRSDQVTNNLRIAGQLAAADANAQAALRQAMQRQAAPAAATDTTSGSTAPSTIVASAPRSAPSGPVSTIVAGSTGATQSGSGPKLGLGTGAADPEAGNRRAEKVDNEGRRYWRDSNGKIRYDF